MKTKILLPFTLLLISVSLLSCFKKKDNSDDEIMMVHESDTAMNQAMETARNTMPQFVEHFMSDDTTETGFTIKIMVIDSFGTEHLWVNELEILDEGYRGKIANIPEYVQSVSFGSEVEFTYEDISDWAYVDSRGVRQGSYTLKVLLPRMPKEQADYYRKMFRWNDDS